MELGGRIALVTGAARRIGRAIALALARQGCDIAIHFHRSAEEAAEAASQCESLGVRAVAMQADLRSLAGIRGLFEKIDETYGELDLLVNSAAVMHRGDLFSISEEDWDQSLDLNLKAAFFCIQFAARRMRAKSGGAIINISDVAAFRPWTRFPIHSISKAGVEMLTKVAARALAPEIRVNAVAPGLIMRSENTPPAQWRSLGESLPLHRTGTIQDLIRTVIFLMENDYITGETIVVDGGRQLI